MPVNMRKMADLKGEILSKIDAKFSEFKLDMLAELKQQLKIDVAEAFKNKLKKREELEFQSFNSFSASTRFFRTK